MEPDGATEQIVRELARMSQDVDFLRCGADVAETSSVGVWVDIMVSTQRENNLKKKNKKSPQTVLY